MLSPHPTLVMASSWNASSSLTLYLDACLSFEALSSRKSYFGKKIRLMLPLNMCSDFACRVASLYLIQKFIQLHVMRGRVRRRCGVAGSHWLPGVVSWGESLGVLYTDRTAISIVGFGIENGFGPFQEPKGSAERFDRITFSQSQAPISFLSLKRPTGWQDLQQDSLLCIKTWLLGKSFQLKRFPFRRKVPEFYFTLKIWSISIYLKFEKSGIEVWYK